MPLPSRISMRVFPLWFETVMTTGPAPTLFGEIVTFCCVITPVSSSVTGGRGLLAKSLPPPHPARAIAIATTTTAVRINGNLPKPDGTSTCDEAVDLALDLAAHALGDRLHEREVVCVLGSIFIQRNGFKEPNLEFGRQIHCAGRQARPRKCVVDGEVDEPREALKRAHVREDRHRFLGADHGDRDDRNARSQGGFHEAAAPETAQSVALPVQLSAALLSFWEDQCEPALVAKEPLGVRRVSRHQAD